MRIRIIWLVLAGVLAAVPRAEAQFSVAMPTPGEDFGIELGAMLWKPTPVFRIQSGALAGITADDVDLATEFGIENARFTEFRLVGKPGRKHKIRFSYVPVEYTKDATLSRTITIGGRTFLVNLPASADLQWKIWRVGYEWDIVARERGFFGVIAEVKYNKISADLRSSLASVLIETPAPVPTVGVVGRGYPARNFSITAEVTGFKLPDSVSKEFEAKLVDIDVYGTVDVNRHVGARFGYRSIAAEYKVDDDAGDLSLKGTYFGAVVRF